MHLTVEPIQSGQACSEKISFPSGNSAVKNDATTNQSIKQGMEESNTWNISLVRQGKYTARGCTCRYITKLTLLVFATQTIFRILKLSNS